MHLFKKKLIQLIILSLTLTILSACKLSGSIVPRKEIEKPKIYKINGVSKVKIYERSRQWIASNFVSAKNVIGYENKDEGTVIGNAIIDAECLAILASSCQYSFSMRIDAKDGKVKIVLFNSRYSALSDGSRYGWPIKTGNKIDYETKTYLLINSLVKYIKNRKNSSNW